MCASVPLRGSAIQAECSAGVKLGLGELGRRGAECRDEFVYVIVVRRPDLLPKHLIVTQTGK